MTGHAFQALIEDAELRIALDAVRSALKPEGRFVFETRNPSARGWEQWTPENAVTIEYGGEEVRMEHQVESPVVGESVSFTATFRSPNWDCRFVSRSTLRFLSAEKLVAFLIEANLNIREQFGDWDRSPLADDSPEIITIADRG